MTRSFTSICTVCGNPFSAGKRRAKYCSGACSQRAFRLRQMAQREAQRRTITTQEWIYRDHVRTVIGQDELARLLIEFVATLFDGQHRENAMGVMALALRTRELGRLPENLMDSLGIPF